MLSKLSIFLIGCEQKATLLRYLQSHQRDEAKTTKRRRFLSLKAFQESKQTIKCSRKVRIGRGISHHFRTRFQPSLAMSHSRKCDLKIPCYHYKRNKRSSVCQFHKKRDSTYEATGPKPFSK